MNLLGFLKAEGGAVDRTLFLSYLASGVANGLLLTVIVAAANPGAEGPASPALGRSGLAEPPVSSFVQFIAFLAIFVMAEKYVLDQSVRTLEGVIRGVRVRITDKLRRADLPDFERIGHPRIYSVLSQDTVLLGTSAYAVIRSFSSVIVLVFGFLYIAMLSETAFLGVLVVLALGLVMHMGNQRIIQKEMKRGAEIESDFFASLRHLLLGFKELSVNAAKSQDLFNNRLEVLALENEKLKVGTGYRINTSTIFPMVHFYLLIGFVIFGLPLLGVGAGEPAAHDLTATNQIVTMILFFLGPLGNVLGAYPALVRADFAIERIRALESDVDGVVVDSVPEDHSPPAFETLTTQGLSFTYFDPDGKPGFTAGPFDLEFKRGSITFLVGGNGTGKSTLLHLLCGLHAPTAGHVSVNGGRVEPDRLSALRAYYSIILQDFHLFDRLYGVHDLDLQRAEALTEELGLTGVTRVLPDGRLERINLSTGQKKRLALLVSELDNREILMFDEWAADQDPEHRRDFYTRYLPQLKARHKTVIAATHDDHYFGAADEVIKLAEGKVVYRGPPQELQHGS